MSVIIDGTAGITTPSETNTGTLSVAGATTLSTGILAVGTNQIYKDSSGNVGIGTTTPSTFNTTGGRFVVAGGAVQALFSDAVNYTLGIKYLGSGTAGMFGATAGSTLALMSDGTQQAAITAAGLLQFNSGYGSVATAYGCRAWVNFNGTGTVSIRASGNVSSIVDNDIGNYTVNFTTAMVDANYSVAGATLGSGETSGGTLSTGLQDGGTPAVGSVSMTTRAGGSTRIDVSFVQVAIFR